MKDSAIKMKKSFIVVHIVFSATVFLFVLFYYVCLWITLTDFSWKGGSCIIMADFS